MQKMNNETKTSAPVTFEGEFPETREKLSPMRKAIAKAMVHSKHTAPHVTLMDEVDVTELVAHRKKFKEIAAEKNIKLTYLPYVVKALVSTLREFPALNTSYDDETNEVIQKHYFNIGIAADTDKGLLVPVIKNADRKSVFAISDEINALARKARDGKLSCCRNERCILFYYEYRVSWWTMVYSSYQPSRSRYFRNWSNFRKTCNKK